MPWSRPLGWRRTRSSVAHACSKPRRPRSAFHFVLQDPAVADPPHCLLERRRDVRANAAPGQHLAPQLAVLAHPLDVHHGGDAARHQLGERVAHRRGEPPPAVAPRRVHVAVPERTLAGVHGRVPEPRVQHLLEEAGGEAAAVQVGVGADHAGHDHHPGAVDDGLRVSFVPAVAYRQDSRPIEDHVAVRSPAVVPALFVPGENALRSSNAGRAVFAFHPCGLPWREIGCTSQDYARRRPPFAGTRPLAANRLPKDARTARSNDRGLSIHRGRDTRTHANPSSDADDVPPLRGGE